MNKARPSILGFALLGANARAEACAEALWGCRRAAGRGGGPKPRACWRSPSASAAWRHVTLPMLRPVTFFVVVMSIAKSFQVFGQVFVMTQGGPSNSTLTIVQYLYVVGFTWFEMGYASAIAYALFALLLVITVIQFRMTARGGAQTGSIHRGLAVQLGCTP